MGRSAARAASVAVIAAALALAACSKEEESAKTPEQVAAEQQAAREKAKQGPMGEPIKALDKAATVQGTVDDQGQKVKGAVEQQTGDAPAEAPTTDAPPP